MNGRQIAYWIIGIGIFISLLFLWIYLTRTTELNFYGKIDHKIFTSYGSLVGGILGALFSLAGIFLLINTLQAQEAAIQNQQSNFNSQFFENRYFELMKIHRENSNGINIKNRSGKKIFITLQREFYRSKLIIDSFNETAPVKLKENEVINIAYLCFFHGAVGEASEKIIKNKLSVSKDYVNSILNMFKENQTSIRKEDKFIYKPFEGHQSRLSHYYRHLYQTVRFVNQQPTDFLNYQDKYQFIKMLRAQLSTQEQALLLFNSLSDLGANWERNPSLELNDKLITKYNIIKNIPAGYILGMNIKKYYPLVAYEGDKENLIDRSEIESRFT